MDGFARAGAGRRYDDPAQYVHCRLFRDGVHFSMISLQGRAPELVVVPAGTIEVRWVEAPDFRTEHVSRIEVGTGEPGVLELASDS